MEPLLIHSYILGTTNTMQTWIMSPIRAQFFQPNTEISSVCSPFSSPKFMELAKTVSNIPDTPKIGNKLIMIAVIKYCQVYANWINKFTIKIISALNGKYANK